MYIYYIHKYLERVRYLHIHAFTYGYYLSLDRCICIFGNINYLFTYVYTPFGE
jgi:hypothetical protein